MEILGFAAVYMGIVVTLSGKEEWEGRLGIGMLLAGAIILLTC